MNKTQNFCYKWQIYDLIVLLSVLLGIIGITLLIMGFRPNWQFFEIIKMAMEN